MNTKDSTGKSEALPALSSTDLLGRRTRPSRRKSERRNVHICARCLAEFKTKGECWWHMDNVCPHRSNDQGQARRA
jgi:hypothetical protein